MTTSFKVVLFDLGGVLVELGEEPIPSEWLSGNTKFDLVDWFTSETAVLFEKGQIDAQSFAQRLKVDLNIKATNEEVIEQFTKWPIGLFGEVTELLESLKSEYTLALLSNSNQLHWPRLMEEFGLAKYFDHIFASHHMNMAKPDLEIFEAVIEGLNVKPNEILFFDDNLNNVEASKKVGINAYRVSGVQQVSNVLESVGIK